MPRKRETGSCPAEAAVRVIGGRWKVPILWHLYSGPRRFCQLQRALGGLTPKMLIQNLRELESDGMIRREVYRQIPPKVEYSLTERGKTLRPIILAMCKWAGRCKAAPPGRRE